MQSTKQTKDVKTVNNKISYLLPLLKEIENNLTQDKPADTRYSYERSYMGSDERVAEVANLLRKQIAMNTKTPTAIETSFGRVGIYGANDHVISIKKESISDTIKALSEYVT